jgi:hypothetical protein
VGTVPALQLTMGPRPRREIAGDFHKQDPKFSKPSNAS